MKAAAAEQRFETAARIKEQLAFAWKWHDKWLPIIRPPEDLNWLLAVPVTRRRSRKLFLFRQGHLSDGPILTDRQLPRAAEKWTGEQLACAGTDRRVDADRANLAGGALPAKPRGGCNCGCAAPSAGGSGGAGGRLAATARATLRQTRARGRNRGAVRSRERFRSGRRWRARREKATLGANRVDFAPVWVDTIHVTYQEAGLPGAVMVCVPVRRL